VPERPTSPTIRNGTWMIQSDGVSRVNVGHAATSTSTSTPTSGTTKRLPRYVNTAPTANTTANPMPITPTPIKSQ